MNLEDLEVVAKIKFKYVFKTEIFVKIDKWRLLVKYVWNIMFLETATVTYLVRCYYKRFKVPILVKTVRVNFEL